MLILAALVVLGVLLAQHFPIWVLLPVAFFIVATFGLLGFARFHEIEPALKAAAATVVALQAGYVLGAGVRLATGNRLRQSTAA